MKIYNSISIYDAHDQNMMPQISVIHSNALRITVDTFRFCSINGTLNEASEPSP